VSTANAYTPKYKLKVDNTPAFVDGWIHLDFKAAISNIDTIGVNEDKASGDIEDAAYTKVRVKLRIGNYYWDGGDTWTYTSSPESWDILNDGVDIVLGKKDE
jgi:hypothetical protein